MRLAGTQQQTGVAIGAASGDELHPQQPDLDVLARALARLDAGQAMEAVRDLIGDLAVIRRERPPGYFRRFGEACRAHPLAARLRQDPFTRRALDKPRGYAGDAVMLDYIYSGLEDAAAHEVSDEGAAIFSMTARWAPSAVAVRQRRDLLAVEIDEVAQRVDAGRVLAVACGHLREARVACHAAALGELVAFDQDEESLEEVRRSTGGLRVTLRQGTVRDLLRRTVRFGDMDLAYAAGLYDYLDAPAASRLTEVLFDALRPGGRMLVANFTPGFGTAGYMEAFMDWTLVTRDEEGLAATAAGIDPALIASQRTFRGPNGYLAYLEIVRV